jgi:hypothetical protein
MRNNEKELSSQQRKELLGALQARFEKNPNHHQALEWLKVQSKLKASDDEKLWSLYEMERTGGEPDVLVMTKRRANTFFMIARRKVRRAVEIFATTMKR